MLKEDQKVDLRDLPEDFELDPLVSLRVDRASGQLEVIALEADVVTPEGRLIGTIQRVGLLATIPLSDFEWSDIPQGGSLNEESREPGE